MSKLLAIMSVKELVGLAHYHATALRQKAETKHLVRPFDQVFDRLKAAQRAEADARTQSMDALLSTIFAEGQVSSVIVKLSFLACALDGSETPVYAILFPRGLRALLEAEGNALLAEALRLRELVVRHPAAVDVKAQIIASFDEVVAKLGQATASRDRVEIEVTRIRGQVEKERLEFLAAYEREAATIDALFPKPEHEKLRKAYFHDRQDDYELESSDVNHWFSTGSKGPVKPS